MERTSLCAVCDYYEVSPLSLAVDPACRSANEMDALCTLHRARATEGYCVLCARRAPWATPWPESAIGACEPCLRGFFSGSRVGLPVAEPDPHAG